MSVIPVVSAARLLAALLKAGFKILRQKGSHIRIAHPITKKVTTVPLHAGDLGRKLTQNILKQAGISMKEFIRLLRR